MTLTGGELNWLNGKHGISAPYRSVPVMKLIREHHPKSKGELIKLIEYHYKSDCKCGIKSQGTIQDFGKNLYEAQIKEWGEYRYSLEECIRWEYHLFVTQSLKGRLIEDRAKEKIENELSKSYEDEISIEDANKFFDEDLRIDQEIKYQGKTMAGIQVKPESFKFMRESVKYMHKNQNSKVCFPVFYLYYNYKSEKFINLTLVNKDILELLNDYKRSLEINRCDEKD